MTDVDLLYIDDYPELKQLCWDFNSETVSKRKAFSLYIDRWECMLMCLSLSSFLLNQPHSLTYVDSANAYFAVDTNNDQIVAFDSLSAEESGLIKHPSLGQFTFAYKDRPHDIVFNHADEFVYVIYKKGIMRFKATSSSSISNVEVLTKADIEVGLPTYTFDYSRSLSLIGGKLYISSSKRGDIIEISDLTNFSDTSDWLVHYNQDTLDKDTYASAGIWDTHGLIINDIEYLNGYWYATNEYHDYQGVTYNDTEKRTNKLIRWKTWVDFYNSKWDDLGHLIPNGSNAYYLTVNQGKLYVSAFKTKDIERADANVVLRLD